MKSALRSACAITAVAVVGAIVASCASPTPKASIRYSKSSMAQPPAAGEEYFSEAAYGVKASPRVASQRSRLRRGGGRYKIGKPYKVRGRWYYPKEDTDYDKKGSASWYGEAFHGRLTANGEIYDMAQLTAAHPTMPLPSYARVTNLENGHSVMVRVNDRGPYAHNRIIDLSARAAQLLEYTHDGTAKVRVQYVGRAPLNGHDDEFLLASYERGDGLKGPSGLPGTMVAKAGSQPSLPGVTRRNLLDGAAVPVAYAPSGGQAMKAATSTATGTDLVLPESAPLPPVKPLIGLVRVETGDMSMMAYADRRIRGASAFDALLADSNTRASDDLTPRTIAGSWNRSTGVRAAATSDTLIAGSFTDLDAARALQEKMLRFGRTTISSEYRESGNVHVVTVRIAVSADPNTALRAAWEAGAEDAFLVRENRSAN